MATQVTWQTTLIFTIAFTNAFAQGASDNEFLKGLNEELLQQQEIQKNSSGLSSPENMSPWPIPMGFYSTIDAVEYNYIQPPDYGLILRDEEGNAMKTFGAVPYTTDTEGTIFVTGYEKPKGSTFQLVSQQEWIEATERLAAEMRSQFMKPIEMLPDIVTFATDYLAGRLCGNPSRPSTITLVLSVSATGGVVFMTAGTEAGSEVSWNFADVCVRQGLE